MRWWQIVALRMVHCGREMMEYIWGEVKELCERMLTRPLTWPEHMLRMLWTSVAVSGLYHLGGHKRNYLLLFVYQVLSRHWNMRWIRAYLPKTNKEIHEQNILSDDDCCKRQRKKRRLTMGGHKGRPCGGYLSWSPRRRQLCQDLCKHSRKREMDTRFLRQGSICSALERKDSAWVKCDVLCNERGWVKLERRWKSDR